MKLWESKKGEDEGGAHLIGRKIFFYIFLLIIIGMLVIFFVLFIDRANVARTTLSQGSKADLYLARITNVCMTATDPKTGEARQNILDYSAITSQQLADCFLSSYPPALTIRVKPLAQNAFPQASAQLNNGGTSDKEFVRYTLVQYNVKLIPAHI